MAALFQRAADTDSHWVTAAYVSQNANDTRKVVRGIYDQRGHGYGLAGIHSSLERIGEKHASGSVPMRRAVKRTAANVLAGLT